MLKSPKELKEQETQCFHSKVQLQKTALGVGVSISRLPRTGEIRSIEATQDLLSLKSYMKENVRFSLNNQKFTHWLPVYLGDNFDKYLHLIKKSISMICTGSTKKFNEKQILEVMPKVIITLVVELMNETSHTSLKAIQTINYFYRLFRLLLKEYPNIEELMNEKIQVFIQDAAKRHKDHTPNLGDLLAMASVSDKYRLNDILGVYTQEQLERQIFWILKDLPQLEEEKAEYDEHLSEVSFKSGMVGFHITLFFESWNRIILELSTGKKDNAKLTEMLDQNFGLAGDKLEDALQAECRRIREVKDFKAYYAWLQTPIKSEDEMIKKLKDAMKASAEKKYHGNED